jgi:hypothetical protein
MNKENIFFTDSGQIGQKHIPTRENDKMATGGTILLAPNGEPSGLYFTEIYNLVRTPEFKAWFGDWEEAYRTKDYEGVSKIIDENGEPLICVHNTPNEFYEFDEYRVGENTDAGFYGKGFYFTPTVGQSRYGEIELNCFLNIKNPFFKQSTHRTYELKTDELESQGYDGVVVYPNWLEDFNFENGVDRCEEVVAYHSEQIKLGDGRNTTFDPYNADIRFRDGGQINSSPFMEWFSQWYEGISDKMNILFSLPSEIVPFKEKNVVILDVFEKIDQNINAKPYLNEITKKADEYGVTIYLEPTPKHNHFQDNLEKKKKITKGYLIEYYEKFGFQLTPNKQFMKRLPKNNSDIRFENGGEIDSKVENAKAELLKAFPNLNKLDFLGKGRFGYSFLIDINYELYVVKYTTSLTEFWATQMAMVSNAPHVVKFLDAKELSEQFTYGIIHEYVNRDGMINEDVWNYALLKADGLSPRKQGLNIEEIKKKVPPKALEYEINLVTKLVNELKSFFGTDLDLLQQNWGYNSNGELVLFDLDGNIKKAQYLEWMEKYKTEPKMAGGGSIDINEPFNVNGKTLAERVRILLKQLYPDYKWSVTSSYNKLDVYLLEADFDPFSEKWKEAYPTRELYYNVNNRDLRETNREDGNLTDRAIEVFKPIREYIDRFVYNRNADDPYADYSDYNIYEYTYIGKWDKPYKQVEPKAGKKKSKAPITPTVAPTTTPPKADYPFKVGDILALSTEELNSYNSNRAFSASQECYLIQEINQPFSTFIQFSFQNDQLTVSIETENIIKKYVKATAPLFNFGDMVVKKSAPNNPQKIKHRAYYQQIGVKYSTLEKRFLLSGMYWNYELEDGTYANEGELELYSATHSIASYTTPNDVFTIQNIVSKTQWSEGLKSSMTTDFIISGYEDVRLLIGANKQETSNAIQKKVDGFASEKNTYLQANMLAEIIHKLIDTGNVPFPATSTQPEPKFKVGDVVRYKGATENLIVDKSTYSDTFQTYLYDLRWQGDGKPTTETEDKLELVSTAQPTTENTFLDYLTANTEKANEITKELEVTSSLAMFVMGSKDIANLDSKKYAELMEELLKKFPKLIEDDSTNAN